jgi:hypothetical protein
MSRNLTNRIVRFALVGTLACGAAGGVLIASASARPQPAATDALPEFTLLVMESKPEIEKRDDPVHGPGYWQEYAAYFDSLKEAGIFVSGAALLPPQAGEIVRVQPDGSISAAPLTLSDNQPRLGGSFVIRARDLASARQWAAKCPSARTGHVEVRPNLPMNSTERPTAPAR